MSIEEPTVALPESRTSLSSRIKKIFISIKNGIIRFAEASWKGAAIGAVLAMMFHLMLIGSFFETGISPIVDWLMVLLLSLIIIIGTGLIAKSLFKIIRRFNPWFAAVLIATLLVAQFLPLKVFGQNLIILELICGALAGFAISGGIKKVSSLIILLTVLLLNILVIIGLSSDGSDTTIPVTDKFWKQSILANVKIPEKNKDFVKTNNYSKVKTLFYGSGMDRHRYEYGKGVNIKTKPVDAAPFFNQSSGFGNFMRELYWGFNSGSYPLNARVWYNESDTPSPLVLIVHGNHNMTDYSDPGYEYLGKALAAQGYIAVSVDENFLNGGWMGDYNQSEVFIRAWLLLKHLQLWRDWNNTENNQFYHKVNMDNICLIGHSRGGAAAAVASVINKIKRYHLDAREKFNFGFHIKGVVQIAPNDPYTPQSEIPLTPENIDYLLLQGGYDQDMSWFLGNRVYNRLKFTDHEYHFKSALYIYRANHGQFNSVWGRTDHSAPLSWFSNLSPIMNERDQQKIAVEYISDFLAASFNKSEPALMRLKDFRLNRMYLPKDYYFNQFEDTKFHYIADYQEDFDVNSGSIHESVTEGQNLKVWSENALSFRDEWNSSQQNSGVYLGWDKNDTNIKGQAVYSIKMNSIISRDTINNIFFFICNNKDDIKNIDFTLELVSRADTVKVALNDLRILPPPLKTSLSKWPFIHTISGNNKAERVLQLTEIPAQELVRRNKHFNISELTGINFIFDKTKNGEIFLDKIGWN